MQIKKVYNSLKIARQRLTPSLGQCINCASQTYRHNIDICTDCALSIQMPTQNLCQCCSLPLPSNHALFCGECLSLPPHFQKTIALGLYQFPLNKMIYSFKQHGKHPTGKVLSHLLGEQILHQYNDNKLPLPDCLIPVPIHWQRHWQRGFNQTAEIANHLSQQLNIPVKHHLCKKRHNPLQQKKLNKKQRQKSLKHSFIIPAPKINYQHIALIDDVMTTGATARALSRAFALKGVQSIDCWIIARTPKNSHI